MTFAPAHVRLRIRRLVLDGTVILAGRVVLGALLTVGRSTWTVGQNARRCWKVYLEMGLLVWFVELYVVWLDEDGRGVG